MKNHVSKSDMNSSLDSDKSNETNETKETIEVD